MKEKVGMGTSGQKHGKDSIYEWIPPVVLLEGMEIQRRAVWSYPLNYQVVQRLEFCSAQEPTETYLFFDTKSYLDVHKILRNKKCLFTFATMIFAVQIEFMIWTMQTFNLITIIHTVE